MINCIAFAIGTKADYRPLFFGSWDMLFGENENGTITYCPEMISSIRHINMTKSLYNAKVRRLYDRKRDKAANFDILKRMVNLKNKGQYDLIQTDTFHLPYDAINYRKHHFPHFIILNSRNDGTWQVDDPYNSWQGELANGIVRDAVAGNDYTGWFRIDTNEADEPAAAEIIRLFESEFTETGFSLIDQLKKYLGKFGKDPAPELCRELAGTVAQYVILYKTKSSYEYAFSFFSEKLNIESDVYISMVDNYLKEWNALTFKLLKFAMSARPLILQKIFDQIEEMYRLEQEIKSSLKTVYDRWKSEVTARC